MQGANTLQKPITITKNAVGATGGSGGSAVVVTLNIPVETGINGNYANLRFRHASGSYLPFTARNSDLGDGTVDVQIPILPVGSTTIYMEYGDETLNYIKGPEEVYYTYSRIDTASGLMYTSGTMYQYARIQGAVPYSTVGKVVLCSGAGTRGELVYDLPSLGPHYEMFAYVRAASGVTADAMWFYTSGTSYGGNTAFSESTDRGGYSFEMNPYGRVFRLRDGATVKASLASDATRDGMDVMLHGRVVNNVVSMKFKNNFTGVTSVGSFTSSTTKSGRYFGIGARSGGVDGTFALMYDLCIARLPDYPYSVSIGAAENITPAAPVTLAASSVSASGFTARWNAATDAKEYFLDVSTSSSFGSFVSGYNNLNVGNTTSRALTGLNAGSLYYYRVRAKNVGTSGNSGTISVWTIPPNPTANNASSISATGFTANWSAATGATNYYLDVSTSSSFSSYVSGYQNLSVGNVTSRSVTGLSNGTTYYYRLRARNSGGTSGNSGTITVATWSKPGVSSPTVSNVGQTSATLGATVASDGGASVTARGTVWGTAASPTGNALAQGGTGTGAFTHNRTGLPAGTLICFRGYAVNAVGTSYSPDQWFWTLPANPTANAASSLSGTGFTANWSAATGATNYYLDVSTSSSFSSYVSGYQNLSVGNVTSRSVTGLANGTTYYYRVRTQNSGGTSGNSGTITVATWSKPGVTSPTVSGVGQTSATLGATVSSDGGSAVTARGTVWGTAANPTGNAVAQGGTGTGAFTHNRTGLPAGTLIYYRGYAVSAVGTGYSPDGSFWTVPANPTATAATLLSNTGFSATWSAVAGATEYYLDVSVSSDFAEYNMLSGYNNKPVGNVTSHHVTVPSSYGMPYYYRVRAHNSAGTSGHSGTIQAVPLSFPRLNTPTVYGISTTGAVLGANLYDAGNSPVTARGTVWSTSPNPVENAMAEGGTGTGAFTHGRTGMTPGAFIYFRGYAVNSAGTNYSAEGSFRTLPLPPVLNAPSNVTLSGFQFSWNASTGAERYLLDVSTNGSFGTYVTGYQAKPVGQSYPTVAVTGLLEGVMYHYRLRAENASGISEYSTAGSVETLSRPVVALPVFSSITQTSAVLGATVIRAGNPAVLTSRGTVWDYEPNPTDQWMPVSGTVTGSFTHARTGMLPGMQIHFRGYAVNGAGTAYSEEGVFWTVPPNPTAVQPVYATVTDTSFEAQWLAAQGATHYWLDVSETTNFVDFVPGYQSRPVGTQTVALVTNLQPRTRYYYRVRAENSGGISGPSEVQWALTSGRLELSAPVATDIGQTSATLGATVTDAGQSPLTERGTVWGTGPSPTGNALAEGGTGTGAFSHARTDLPAGTLIYYRGYAASAEGTAYSLDGTFWTLPPNPSAFGAAEVKRNSFIAQWGPATGATAYLLDVSTQNTFASYVPGYQNRSMGSETTGIVTGLTENVTYYFRVRAQNSGGMSGYSGTIPVQTIASLRVTAPTATNVGQTSATLGAAIYDAEAGEIVLRGTVWGTTPNPTGHVLAAAGTGMGSFSHVRTNLPAGTLIYYRGYAERAEGTVYSPDGSFWTLPPDPEVLAATSVSTNGFTANWGAATGATNYLLDVSTDSGFSSFVSGYENRSVGLATTCLVEDLDLATRLYYRVRAQNSGGISGYSAVESARYTPSTVNVSGRVTDAGSGAGAAGVTLVFSNGGGSATTDSQGYFTKPVPYGWTGTIQISGSTSSAVPSERTVSNLQTDLDGQHFVVGGTIPWADAFSLYRKSIWVSNALDQVLTDFQVEIDVEREPGMMDGFRDLRFTDRNGQSVPYWYERTGIHNVASATFGGSAVASVQQTGYAISASLDGVETGTGGWAVNNVIPATGVYRFAGDTLVDEIQIISGVGRTGYNPIVYDLYYSTEETPGLEGTWLPLEELEIANSAAGSILTNTVSLEGSPDDVRLRFKPVRATGIKIHVRQANTANFVLTEFKVFAVETVTVWLKAPALAAAGNTELLMYYGNSNAVYEGNGDNVFRFFDDFEDGVVSAEKWPSQAGVGTYLFETNGVLQVNRVAGANVHLMSHSFTTSDLPMIVESRAKTVTLPTNGWIPLGLWLSSTRWVAFLEHAGSRLYGAANTFATYATKTLSDYHRLGIAFAGTNTCEMRAVFPDIPTQSATNTIAYTPWGEEAYAIRLVDRYNWTTAQSMNGQIDAIWIREYAGIEPVASPSDEIERAEDLVTYVAVSVRVVNATSGAGVDGVVMMAGDQEMETIPGDGGWHQFFLPMGWSGTVTAQSEESGRFEPAALPVGPVAQTMALDPIYWWPTPQLSGVEPDRGPTEGGTSVLLTGEDFSSSPVPAVLFGDVPSPSVVRLDATTLRVTAPAHPVGWVDITVCNADGQSGTLSHGFYYHPATPVLSSISPDQGSVLGGTAFELSGGAFPVRDRQVYAFTGSTQHLVVPDGYTTMRVKIWGAGGAGSSVSAAGGAGGYTEGILDVSAGQVFDIVVGEGGLSIGDTRYTYGGGGCRPSPKGGLQGGGRSALRLGEVELMTAGGGGCGETAAGGTGGGEVGGTSLNGRSENGKGGEPAAGGAGGKATWSGHYAGAAGGHLLGGSGNTRDHTGAGGGGGWYGGGGGGAGNYYTGSGGGGSGHLDESVRSGFTTNGSLNLPPRMEDADYLEGIGLGGTVSTNRAGGGLVVVEFGYDDVAVYFGSELASHLSAEGGDRLLGVTPANPPGPCDVLVVQSSANHTTRLVNAFTYNPVIQGRVVNGRTGEGVDGVEIRESGGGSATTSGGGYYTLVVPYNQPASVTAEMPEALGAGEMTPAGRTYTAVTQNQEEQDFTWNPADPVVSGRIWNEDTEQGQDGVLVTWTGAEGSVSVISSNGGQYVFAVPYGSTGTVSFAYGTDYGAGTFAPPTHGFTNLTANAFPETWWEPPYVPGIRYVSLTGEHEYPYTNTLMAARDVQTAINASGPGDLVLVLPGRYDISKAVTLNKPVTVRSTGNATNTVIRRVSGNTGVAYLTATNAVLDGFTLEGGYINVWSPNAYGSAVGAGVHNGAVIQNCVIRHNVAGPGRGNAGIVRLADGSRAINCVISANTVQYHEALPQFCVTGVRLDSGSRLINSVVADNQQVYGGYGAGVATFSGESFVENSILWGNAGTGWGSTGNSVFVESGATLRFFSTTYNDTVWVRGQFRVDDACMPFDPLFVNAAARDYRLRPESFALQTGVDAYNPLTNDILRRPRRVGTIDRGAYEYSEVLPRIIGRVTNEYTGAGWSGVTMTFEDLTNVTSLAGGWFGTLVPMDWSGVVTPSFPTGWFLHPPDRSYTVVTGEVNNQLFSWRPQHPFISGRIVHQNLGTGIDGVTVLFSENAGSTVTTNGGYYMHVVTGRWSGAVTPSHEVGGSFEPPSAAYTNVITNQYAKNFTWVPVTRPVSGRITHAYTGAGVDGVSVNFPGSGSVVSSGGGYYVANVYYNYSGRATPMLAGGTFADPASRTYADVTEAQTSQDYVWTPNDPVITGRITNQYTQAGQSGIVVTFSNGGGAATTGVDGVYARVLPWNWSGTATPSFEVGTFSAASRTYANVQFAQSNQHYAWTPDVRLISGRITHLDSGEGISGIPVASTPYHATVVTDAGGYYSITSFWGWSGTIEPEAPAGGNFVASRRTVNDLRNDLAAQDFVWAPDRVVSGRVTHEDTGDGVEGVTLTFTPEGGTAVTGADGQFSKALPHGWSGSLGAGFTSGSFAPASRAQAALTADRTGQDFTWLPPRTIAGRLLNEDTGVGLPGVGLYRGTNRLAATASDGSYQFTVQQGWSATVNPEAIGGAWLPASRTYANLQLDQDAQDYTWRPPRTVMGRITNTITGGGVSGVVLTFSGGAGTATTGSDGSYAASIRQGWTGTITPAKNGFTFAPVSRSLSGLTSDQAGLDFAGTPTTVALAGRVTHAYTGEPINKFGLTFSNGGGSGLTGTNGEYSVNVPYGWSGTVSFSDAHGTATPAGRTYATLQEPRSGQNYVWTPAPRTISGTVTNAETGEAVAYATLQISGGLTAETAEDGRYSFTAYRGWAGTWTPELDGLLAPESRSTTNLANNLAAQHFGWTPPRSLSGRLTDAATGEPVSGGTIGLSSGPSATSDEAGLYELHANKGWSGSIQAAMPGYVFMPLDYTFSDLQDGRNDLDFVRHVARIVSGRVTNYYTGDGVSNMVVSFENLSSVTTDVSGAYAYPVWHGWSGSLLVSSPRGGYFNPALRILPAVTADVGNQHFAWLPADPVLSGRVTNVATGAGAYGVVITFSDGAGSVTSGVNGVYQMQVPRGWSGSWTASADEGHVLEPVSYSRENVQEDEDGCDFAWLPPDPLISGRITHQNTGEGLAGIQVQIGGQAVETTGDGYYSLTVPLHWSGTLVPEPLDPNGVFAPVSRTLQNLVAHAPDQHFQWRPAQTISGRVTNYYSGDGVPGVDVTATGGISGTTDAGGDYELEIPPNWQGVVTPALPQGVFTPASRSYGVVTSPQASQNFSWMPPPSIGTRYVSRDGGHQHPYTNWAMAATNLYTAVRIANPGETVWVSSGVHAVRSTIAVDKPIRIRSLHGAAETILRREGDSPFRVLYLNHGNCVVNGFTIENGWATGNGGGVFIQQGYLHSSIVHSNRADGSGGGIFLGHSISARAANLLVVRNSAQTQGGIQGEGVVVNCTVVDNTPAHMGATVVYNAISDGPISATEVRYCLTPGLQAGLGNQSGTPQFVDAAAGNYRLLADSPGVDQGFNDYMVLPFDLDGGPRALGPIDLGPYEQLPKQGLAVALSSEPAQLPAGDLFEYIYTVVNGGPGTALGVVVTSALPGGVTYLSDDAGGTYQPAAGIWTIGSLEPMKFARMVVQTRADQPGYWTNAAVVTASQADPGEPGYDRAECVTRVLDDVVITNLAASTSSGNSTVKWDSVVGMGYSVYSSDDPVGLLDDPEWEERATMVASEQIRDFLDTDTASSVVTRRYYQVTYSGRRPTASNMWALIRRDVRPAGCTLVSPPVRIDRRFNGELGRALSEVLTGHNGGIGSAADEVFVLEGTSWRQLYLDATKTWREADGTSSTYELPAGQGFWVARKSDVPARITFTGPVGNDGRGAIPLQPGFNLLGLSEGRDLPLAATLATAQPVGGAVEETADLLVIQQPGGAWRFLMFVTNWGAPYDGKWFDLNAGQIVPAGETLEPGAAYYYLRREKSGHIQF